MGVGYCVKTMNKVTKTEAIEGLRRGGRRPPNSDFKEISSTGKPGSTLTGSSRLHDYDKL